MACLGLQSTAKESCPAGTGNEGLPSSEAKRCRRAGTYSPEEVAALVAFADALKGQASRHLSVQRADLLPALFCVWHLLPNFCFEIYPHGLLATLCFSSCEYTAIYPFYCFQFLVLQINNAALNILAVYFGGHVYTLLLGVESRVPLSSNARPYTAFARVSPIIFPGFLAFFNTI